MAWWCWSECCYVGDTHAVYIYISRTFFEAKQQCEKAPSSSSSSRVVSERRAIIPIIIAIIKNVIFVAALLTPPIPTKRKNNTSLYQKDPKRSSTEAASFLSAPNTRLLVCPRTPSDFCCSSTNDPIGKNITLRFKCSPLSMFFLRCNSPFRGCPKSEGQLQSLSMGECIELQVRASNPPRAMEIPGFASTKPPSCGDCFRFWWWVSFLWPFREHQKNPSSFGYG